MKEFEARPCGWPNYLLQGCPLPRSLIIERWAPCHLVTKPHWVPHLCKHGISLTSKAIKLLGKSDQQKMPLWRLESLEMVHPPISHPQNFSSHERNKPSSIEWIVLRSGFAKLHNYNLRQKKTAPSTWICHALPPVGKGWGTQNPSKSSPSSSKALKAARAFSCLRLTCQADPQGLKPEHDTSQGNSQCNHQEHV